MIEVDFDLYGFYSNPKELIGHAEIDMGRFWHKIDKPENVGKGVDFVASNPEYAYKYAHHMTNGKRWKRGEATIAKDASLAYFYAAFIIGGAFEEGEKAIATHPEYAHSYAALIHSPFPAGEAAIATNSRSSLNYAREILYGRFEKGEPAIAKDAGESYAYAKTVIKGRFPEGEKAINADDSRMNFKKLYYEFLESEGIRADTQGLL